MTPQFIGETADDAFRISLQLTLPYGQNGPASGLKRGLVACIAAYIGVELLLPEVPPRRGHGRVPAAWMPVPETAVDKDGGLIFRQNYIGAAGKLLRVKPEPEACAMQQ